MAAKSPTTRKRAAKKTTKRPTTRAAVAKRPNRNRGLAERLASWLARHAARHAKTHHQKVRSRKDAAILRATHAGCQTCHGTGTLYTKDKHGRLTGSKPCPAKPAVTKVSKTQVHAAARLGVDKRAGLIGWRCPCGKTEKPRYRDAKTATSAIRTHERQRHGGSTIGAAWYAQLPEGTPAPATTPAPVTKTTGRRETGKTNQQWTKQPARTPKGGCPDCKGTGAKRTAAVAQQTITACPTCNGTSKKAA